MVSNDNYALLLSRQNKSATIDSFFITNNCSEMKSAERTIQSYHFPLYVYNQSNLLNQTNTRIPNFQQEIINEIAEKLELTFTYEKEPTENTFAPIDTLDYIYAVLHSPKYREKYKEFLKIDFPRIPYPNDRSSFWEMVKLGAEIREIHLLVSDSVKKSPVTYDVVGDNIITRQLTKTDLGYEPLDDNKGRVWINDEQYFDNVPLVAWEFYIGGYQPAQKWLKDRVGRTLERSDIQHYRKLISALLETDRVMTEIDEIYIEK